MGEFARHFSASTLKTRSGRGNPLNSRRDDLIKAQWHISLPVRPIARFLFERACCKPATLSAAKRS
ncbi:hypothetical protein [Dyella sp. 2HG41-7]|uniref:hypothetical protein n=1 Tax=Dyella sp. 2HG41-7 TaxID=2883239 RepID=UPI001F2B76A3|nr:hypothetical protein [Dyella sp. 2HG41-7]